MRIIVASLCLTLNVLSGFAAEEVGTRAAEAEAVAPRYLTAFFHSDLRTAASLTHPETLQQLKSAFGQERAAAAAGGKEAEFLAQYGMEPRPISILPTSTWLRLAASAGRSHVEVAAMKAMTITVKDSKRTNGERVAVTLVITAPAATGTQTQDAGLSLALVDGLWKVIGNVP